MITFSGWLMALLRVPNDAAIIFLRILDTLPLIFFVLTFRLRETDCFFPSTTRYWCFFLLFFLFAIISTIFQGGSLGTTMAHIGIMFRFVPLSYFISKTSFSDEVYNIFTFHFKIISGILLLIGVIEIIGGEQAAAFFSPVKPEKEVDPPIVLSVFPIESISGIFPNTIDYAFFLVIAYIYFLNQKRLENRLLPRPVLDIFFLFLIFASGSKAALIIALVALFIGIECRLVKYSVLIIILIIASWLLWMFWDLFYWVVFEDSLHSRLGLIVYTLPCFLKKCSLSTFFGVTPDREIVFNEINAYPIVPSMLQTVEDMHAFEDEFYVALIIYYGIVGFGLLVGMYYKLYKTLDNMVVPDDIMNSRFIIRSLFICLITAPLFNQIIITRPFSLFFWIIIGVIYNRYKQYETLSHI